MIFWYSIVITSLIFVKDLPSCSGINITVSYLYTTSEEAKMFAFIVNEHNKRPDKKFHVKPAYSMQIDLDSTKIRQKICKHFEYNNSVAIFGPNLWHAITDIYDLISNIGVPFFTSETYPLEFTNYTLPTSSSSENEPLVNSDLGFKYEYTQKMRRSESGEEKSENPYGTFSENDAKIHLALQAYKKSYVIQLRPSVIEAVANLIVRYNWINFSYVCNTGEGLYRLQKIIEFIHKISKDYIEIYVDIRYIPDPRVATKDLRHLDTYLCDQTQKQILVDFDTIENVKIFMDKVVLMGMNRREYHYILTGIGLDEMELDEFRYSGVNITGFQIFNTNSSEAQTLKRNTQNWRIKSYLFQLALMSDAFKVFTDTINIMLNEPSAKGKLMNYIDEKRPKMSCYVEKDDLRKVYVEGKENNEEKIGDTFIEYMDKRSINLRDGLTGNLDFNKQGARNNTVIDILSLIEYREPSVIGTWDPNEGLNMSLISGKSVKTQNRTVRVVTILAEPFARIKSPKAGEILTGNDRFEGFAIDVIKEVSKMVGFKYEIHPVYDEKFGAPTGNYFSNGTAGWNGMIGEILNGTADLAVAPLTISLARAKVVKFTEPFLTFGISIMIKKPGKTKPGIFSFLLPLSIPTWWCIMAACVVVSCALYIIARVSPFEWTVSTHDNGVIKVERDFTFFNSFWFSFAAFVQQGVDIAPKSPGARILSSTWWFFTLIMIAYYTANLAAFLTVARMVTPINDWNDLRRYEETGIDFGPIKDGSTHQFFNKTKLTPFNELGQYLKKNQDKMVSNVKEGIAKVRNSGGKYALILESPENEYNNNQEPCNTMQVGTPFGNKGYGIASHMNFSLNDEINSAVLDLHENEQLALFYKTWWKDKGQCTDDSQQSSSDALALINVAGVFYILTSGLYLALVTTILEFYYSVKSDHNPQSAGFSDFLHQKARLSIHGPMSCDGRRKELRNTSDCSLPHPARTINLI